MMKNLLSMVICALLTFSALAAGPRNFPETPLGTELATQLGCYFGASADDREAWTFAPALDELLRTEEESVRKMAWQTFQKAPVHELLRTNFAAHVVKFEQHTSPYTVKQVGQRPPKGWPLVIAMHGGGGAPKALNDSQWRQMQIYYRDHPELGGYLYLALRAPNDSWNGFYDTYVYPLIDQLILQFRLFGEIDPDKIFLIGYSHGGYGAYAIGPKMPDRFAAIHASAAAATDGETTARTLRTTPFTVMVGERDTMYGRYERNVRFQKQIAELRGGRTDIYPVTITIVQGMGHGGLPDRDKLAELYPAVRNPTPREVCWAMTDSVVSDFFWLHAPKPGKGHEIFATCQSNRLTLTVSEEVKAFQVLLDSRLADLGKPIRIELNGTALTRSFSPTLKTLCATLARRGDPGFAFTAGFEVVRNAQDRLVVR